MVESITLPWAEKIRRRLCERPRERMVEFQYLDYIREFVEPILAYAEAEEKRINKELGGN